MTRILAPRRALSTSVLLTLLLGVSPLGAQVRDALLDVPYVSQTVRLCGGAAVAMVLRYWGETNVFAEDFAPLVNEAEGGIRTTVLTDAVRARGWQAVPLAIDTVAGLAPLQAEINRGRPLVALLEVAPSTYHYVVIVAITTDAVVLHDPARSPFVVTPRAEFERQWAAANRWILLVLPGSEPSQPEASSLSSPPADRPATSPSGTTITGRCSSLIADSVARAQAKDLSGAARGLSAATSLCPEDAAAWRELAGVRFLERNHPEVIRLATIAVARAPDDAIALQLIATSRFLTGDRLGALSAWNRAGEPPTGLISVDGTSRTRHPVVVERTGLQPRQVLDAGAFRRAQRRVADLPAAAATTVRYDIAADGVANVNVFVRERRALPVGPIGWVVEGVRAGVQNEVEFGVAGITGEADLISGAYRWTPSRPRAAFHFAAPGPGRIPGIVAFDASWERQTYRAAVESADTVRQHQRRIAMSVSDWVTGHVHWRVGVARDRVDDESYVAVAGGTTVRAARDHVALSLNAESWVPTGDAHAFSSVTLSGQWRSTTLPDEPALFGSTSWTAVGSDAPLAMWPGASTGKGRTALLRAHPLLDDGVITGEMIGRRLAVANIEYVHPIYLTPFASLAVAGFVDIARTTQTRFHPAPAHVDVGAGVRIASVGADGALRIDVGYGLRDDDVSVSAGYVTRWGR